jgi:hypothetical protein
MSQIPRTSYIALTRLGVVKEEFQQLISEGVQTVGLETMEGIKNRIYEGIVQQEQGESGNGHH